MLIVGGGLAGLHCARRLAEAGYAIKILEAKNNWGGRIETHSLPAPDGGTFPDPAEFGPMRFELAISPLLETLLDDLDIPVTEFSPPKSPPIPIEYPVKEDERETKTGKPLSPLQLLRLGVFRLVGFNPYVIGDKVELPLSENDRFIKWGDDSPDLENRFDTLRQKATGSVIQGSTTIPKLHEMGFWNALSSVLSPAAVAAINHLGSFYHLMPDNPNAVEWAIFWLRLFLPNIQLSTIKSGVNTVSLKLIQTLTSAEYREKVELFSGHRVTALHSMNAASRIAVEYELETGETGQHEADHVILALPSAPLRRLGSVFPDQVQKDLDGVVPFQLLKVFVVMRTPDHWRFAPPQAQDYVWLFPAREVHYFSTHPPNLTMLLLYTDNPSASFWEPYVHDPVHHHAAEIDGQEGLKLELYRRLNAVLLSWAEEQLRRYFFRDRPRRSNSRRFKGSDAPAYRKELAKLWRLYFDARLAQLFELFASLLLEVGEDMSYSALTEMTQVELERYAERLASTNPELSKKEETLLYLPEPGDFRQGSEKLPVARELLRQVIAARKGLLALPIFEDPLGHSEKFFSSIGSYGIRDWSADTHIGAGCHAWRPGFKSWEIRARLKAFGLRGNEAIKNLHICGEAYSDYQGFIEGALRSAEDVVKTILAEQNEGFKTPPN